MPPKIKSTHKLEKVGIRATLRQMLMCFANKLTLTRVLCGQDKRENIEEACISFEVFTEMSSPFTKFLHYNVRRDFIHSQTYKINP